jgi:hypothetical protein
LYFLPQPPYSHRRYDFFKAIIPDYDSPDPRASTQSIIDNHQYGRKPALQSPKSLNFGEGDDDEGAAAAVLHTDTDNTFRELQEIEKNKPVENKKKVNNLLKEFDEDVYDREKIYDNTPAFTEAMVEWKDDTIAPRTRSRSSSSNTSSRVQSAKNFVFAFNNMNEFVSIKKIVSYTLFNFCSNSKSRS